MTSFWDDITEVPAAQTVPEPVRGPLLGTVVELRPRPGADRFPDVLVRLAEGREVLAANEVFPGAHPGDPVLVYQGRGFEWQLHDPAWLLPGPCIELGARPLRFEHLGALFRKRPDILREALTATPLGFSWRKRGEEVPRKVLDGLHTRLMAHPAVAVRVRARALGPSVTYGDPLPYQRTNGQPQGEGPIDLPGFAWSGWGQLPHKKGLMTISDAQTWPVRLIPFEDVAEEFQLQGGDHPRYGLYLLAVEAIARKVGFVPLHVAGVWRDRVQGTLYGVVRSLPTSALSWSAHADARLLVGEGQTLQVQASLRRERGQLILSTLSADDASWKELTARYPEGAWVEEPAWQTLREEGEDQLIALAAGEYRVDALLPRRPTRIPGPDLQLRIDRHDPHALRFVLQESMKEGAETFDSERWKVGLVISGHVTGAQRQALLLDIGVPALLFNTELEPARPSEELLGAVIEVVITAVDPRWHTVVVSQKRLVTAGEWEAVSARHKEGDEVEGVVTRATEGGLEVDIGVSAFLPASQIDMDRPPSIADYVGQTIKCKILKIDEARRNIVLSRRGLLEGQRETTKTKLLAEIEVGQVRKGTIKAIVDFGAFVDLGGVDGLLHITDMSWARVNNPHDVVQTEQELEVYVLRVDREKDKIALSLKHLTPSPWAHVAEKYPVGSRHTGEVVSVMHYGAFVKLEPGIEGLVHISEMSWTRRINHASELVAIGDTVEVQVLNINKEKQEISLGMKQVQSNPWDKVAERYPPGTQITGVVRNLTNYGAFIEIEEGIDGLLHVSDMSWTRKVSHPSEVVQKGDRVTCVVLNIDHRASASQVVHLAESGLKRSRGRR